MSAALALRLMQQNIQETSPGVWEMIATIQVHYAAADGSLFGSGQINVAFPTTATPQQMKTAMTDAVIADAAGLGLTVAANEVILPDLQRG